MLAVGKTGQQQRDSGRNHITQTPGKALQAKFSLDKTDGDHRRENRHPDADKTYHQENSTRKPRNVVMPTVIQ